MATRASITRRPRTGLLLNHRPAINAADDVWTDDDLLDATVDKGDDFRGAKFDQDIFVSLPNRDQEAGHRKIVAELESAKELPEPVHVDNAACGESPGDIENEKHDADELEKPCSHEDPTDPQDRATPVVDSEQIAAVSENDREIKQPAPDDEIAAHGTNDLGSLESNVPFFHNANENRSSPLSLEIEEPQIAGSVTINHSNVVEPEPFSADAPPETSNQVSFHVDQTGIEDDGPVDAQSDNDDLEAQLGPVLKAERDMLSDEADIDDFIDPDWDDKGHSSDGFDDFEIEDQKLENLEFEADIDDYEDGAYQEDWLAPVPEDGTTVRLRKAREKAAEITPRLGISRLADVAVTVDFLVDFFLDHPHPSTFRAISDAADRGLDLPLLMSMVALRSTVIERADFLVGRYSADRSIAPLNQKGAFTWALARRICLAQADYPPGMMIEEEWLDEWFLLRPGDPGYLSFLAYIDLRITHHEHRLLNDGLVMLHRDDIHLPLGDNFRWCHTLWDDVAISNRFKIGTVAPIIPGL